MTNTFFRVNLSGADIEPQMVAGHLPYSVRQLGRRGDRSVVTGRTYDVTTIAFEVGSLEEAIGAIEKLRALASDPSNDAEVNISYAYDEQCNLEFSADDIEALSRVRAALTISCWQTADLDGSQPPAAEAR